MWNWWGNFINRALVVALEIWFIHWADWRNKHRVFKKWIMCGTRHSPRPDTRWTSALRDNKSCSFRGLRTSRGYVTGGEELKARVQTWAITPKNLIAFEFIFPRFPNEEWHIPQGAFTTTQSIFFFLVLNQLSCTSPSAATALQKSWLPAQTRCRNVSDPSQSSL